MNLLPKPQEETQGQPSEIEQSQQRQSGMEYSQAGGETITSEVLKVVLMVDETIQDIENNLRGIDWDSQRSKWVQTRQPQMNDIGINEIMTQFVKPLVNKETFLSNFDEEDIENKVICFGNHLDWTLAQNQKMYGIRNLQMAGNISNWIEHMIDSALKRGLKGNTARIIGGHTVTEIRQIQPEKSGFLGMNLLRRKR